MSNQPAFRIKGFDKQNNLTYDVGTIWPFRDGQFNLSAVVETDLDAQYPKMALTEALGLAADKDRQFYINIYANAPYAKTTAPTQDDDVPF